MRNLIDRIESLGIMDLELRSLPTANDRFVIGIDPEFPAIDVVDKVSESVLDGHQLTDVCAVSLLFWA